MGKRDARANNMLQAFDFTKEPSEPLVLKTGYIKNLSQEKMKNMAKGKSVTLVNLVYFTILPVIAVIGFVIFWVRNRRQNSPDLTQRK